MLLTIVRHAPPLTDGRLAGRRDVSADIGDSQMIARVRARLRRDAQIIASPAQRCLQTAAALGLTPSQTDRDLWEQDYGAWEGLRYADLPDLGALPMSELARHRPDGGESFQDMAARVQPILQGLDRDSVIVAHAGTARAALAMVVGTAALSFAIAPLSLTILRRAGTDWSVEAVNLT